MGKRTGIDAPNYTQVPNVILDEMMADMGHAEFKVVMAIIRGTAGWHRKSARMSITYLEEATGLSRPSVTAGTKKAIARGIVKRTKSGDSHIYELVVKSLNQNDCASKETLLPTSKETLPLASKVTLPNKERTTKERGKESVGVRIYHSDQPAYVPPPPVLDSANFDGPARSSSVKAKATEHQKHLKLPKWLSEHIDTSKLVTDEEGNRNIPRNSGTTPFEVYLEFYPFDPKKMTGAKAYRIAEVVNDLPRWRTVVRDWFDGDHNPNNFRDMFDVYRNGWRNGGNVTAGAVSEDGTMVVNFQGRDITVPPNFVGYVRDGDKETRERYLGLLLSRVRNGVTDASRPAGH